MDGLAQGVIAVPAADHVGDVGGELDDLDHRAGVVEDRIVIGLDEDLAAALAQAAEFAGLETALAQFVPEAAVIGRGGIGRIAELGMELALDFTERIPHHIEEVAIGRQDRA